MALDDKSKQDMESGLEHAVRIVQAYFAQLEQNVFIPCMESSRRFANRYPITATFISIFSMLSIFPVLSFLGFSLLVSAAFAFIAFAGAFLVSVVLMMLAGGALFIALSILFIVSIFLTITLVSLFLTARLGQHLRSENSMGQSVTDWAQETRGRLTWRASRSKGPQGIDAGLKTESGRRGSDEWQAVHNGPS